MSAAEHFSSILRGEPDVDFMSDVVGENQWFALGAALLVRDLTHFRDIRTAAMVRKDFALSFMINSYRGVVPISAQSADFNEQQNNNFDVIDSFLSKSIHKIVPKEDVVGKVKDVEVEDVIDDVVTEQFAKILLLQGHKSKAIEIYNKLSLKFPEKSVYFADQINKIL